jgi:beta-phosphoglucomutase-like phosphatase (HAD superfamily)
MGMAQAFIFDLNGTMIDDMEYHTIAWHSILNDDLHAGLSREEVRRQMYGKNEELLERVFGAGRFSPAEGLGVDPAGCVVFEDAPKGVEAALKAGMRCVVLTTMHGQEEFRAFQNVAGFVADYTDPFLDPFFS